MVSSAEENNRKWSFSWKCWKIRWEYIKCFTQMICKEFCGFAPYRLPCVPSGMTSPWGWKWRCWTRTLSSPVKSTGLLQLSRLQVCASFCQQLTAQWTTNYFYILMLHLFSYFSLVNLILFLARPKSYYILPLAKLKTWFAVLLMVLNIKCTIFITRRNCVMRLETISGALKKS